MGLKYSNGPTVVIDCDGVLANFEDAFCYVFGYGQRWLLKLEDRYPERAEMITNFVKNPLVYKSLEPIELGLDIIRWLDDNGYQISIVSSRPESATRITMEWINALHIPYSSCNIATNGDKIPDIVRHRPIVAIDDLGQVGEKLRQYTIPTLIMAWPWNREYIGKFPRFSDFQEFIRQFRKISGGI